MLEEKTNITYEQYQKDFVAGDQFVVWNDFSNQPIRCDNRFYWEQHSVYNLMKPVIHRWLFSYNIPEDQIFGRYGLVDDLISYQRQYNLLMNSYTNLLVRFTSPLLLVEDGSVDCDELSEEGLAPGKIVVYRQGANQPEILSTVSSNDLEAIKKACEAAKDDFYSAVYRAEEILSSKRNIAQEDNNLNIEVIDE